MAKKKEKLRTCKECIHEYACQAWNVGHISDMDASHCLDYEKAEDSNAYFLGRRKAIEEFSERLKDFIAKNVEDADSSNDLCCEVFQSEIDEIAESMKGEKE